VADWSVVPRSAEPRSIIERNRFRLSVGDRATWALAVARHYAAGAIGRAPGELVF